MIFIFVAEALIALGAALYAAVVTVMMSSYAAGATSHGDASADHRVSLLLPGHQAFVWVFDGMLLLQIVLVAGLRMLVQLVWASSRSRYARVTSRTDLALKYSFGVLLAESMSCAVWSLLMDGESAFAIFRCCRFAVTSGAAVAVLAGMITHNIQRTTVVAAALVAFTASVLAAILDSGFPLVGTAFFWPPLLLVLFRRKSLLRTHSGT